MTQEIYRICPLCDRPLEIESIGSFGQANCPQGHYEYHGRGSYAADAVIKLNGEEEWFRFDDMFGDGEKFDARIKELRSQARVDWDKQGF